MKTALITGASRGIGRCAAILFAESGYRVFVNYQKNSDAANAVCDEILLAGGAAEAIRADISNEQAAKEMFEYIKSQTQTLNVLVNNAGIAPKQALFTDFSAQEIKDVFETNVFGTMNCCRFASEFFIHQKFGKIINVSSIWGISGASCEVPYSASKAAIIGFSKALARELAPSGINVNCVAPGIIDTDMNRHLSAAEKAEFCESVPLGKMGTAQNVAELILFLASSRADYITGQVYTIDGGYL